MHVSLEGELDGELRGIWIEDSSVEESSRSSISSWSYSADSVMSETPILRFCSEVVNRFANETSVVRVSVTE